MTLTDLLERIAELPAFEAHCPLTARSQTCVGETPLHVAAVWGDLDAINLLVDAGADINAIGDRGYTPLHEAVEQGNVQAVKLLLKRGARADIQNEMAMTPMSIAMLKDAEELVQLLKESK